MKEVSTNEGKCVLVEVGALISWCIYSYRIVMLLVPYIRAGMTFLPTFDCPTVDNRTQSNVRLPNSCLFGQFCSLLQKYV